jgi:transcriptional regulator with XRE-family HTH domain
VKGVSKIDKYVIKKVRERRLELGLSQYKLSLEMDLSNSFVGNIESEKKISKWNLSHINELAKILNVSPQYFLPEKPL